MILKTSIITTICFFIASLAFSQNIEFQDKNFEQAVLDHYPVIDTNNDRVIQKEEALNATEINAMNKGITSIEDIYNFPNIKELVVTGNEIEKVKLIGLDSLKEFYCANNNLNFFKAKDLPSLERLSIGGNSLDKISLVNIPKLKSLRIFDNNFEAIDLSEFKELKYFDASNNNLKKIDISNNPKLIQIHITGNNIKEIDIRNNPDFKVNLMYADDGIKIIRNEDQGDKKAVPPPPQMGPPPGN